MNAALLRDENGNVNAARRTAMQSRNVNTNQAQSAVWSLECNFVEEF